MTRYDKTFTLPVAFPPQSLDEILGEHLAELGIAQLRTAETEKYAHVTFFFNGGREEPFAGEERRLVPSPKDVATYDLKPEMSARAVTDGVVDAIARRALRLHPGQLREPGHGRAHRHPRRRRSPPSR